MTPIQSKRLIILSDGTGETAALMMKAAMVQFQKERVHFTRYKNVRNENQIQAICEEASQHQTLLIYTMVSPQLRAFLINCARQYTIPCVDLLGPLLVGLGNYFGYEPQAIAGLFHDVNESYFERIAAMEYTMVHDDGKDLNGLEKADLILLGISRTSKTPLSMYLAHQGWKVANIPLIQDFTIPEEIFSINQKKIIGLTIDPQTLSMIRQARLDRLGQNTDDSHYANLKKINQEIEYSNEIFRKNRRWVVFNVTGKAVEETASEIIKLMISRGLAPPNT